MPHLFINVSPFVLFSRFSLSQKDKASPPNLATGLIIAVVQQRTFLIFPANTLRQWTVLTHTVTDSKQHTQQEPPS